MALPILQQGGDPIARQSAGSGWLMLPTLSRPCLVQQAKPADMTRPKPSAAIQQQSQHLVIDQSIGPPQLLPQNALSIEQQQPVAMRGDPQLIDTGIDHSQHRGVRTSLGDIEPFGGALAPAPEIIIDSDQQPVAATLSQHPLSALKRNLEWRVN
ncbi:MAG: hypothetical protein KDI56_10815, partial [Xanthomonadales bacterium]|nr:hypothetical protein [Xanthomonadales bacterium]